METQHSQPSEKNGTSHDFELADIQKNLDSLLARKQKLIDEKREEAVDKIKSLMTTYGITAGDLNIGGKSSGKKAGGKPALPPKYSDPATGATWSGRGRRPTWLKDKNENEFLVK